MDIKRRRRRNPETDLVVACLAYLKLRRVPAYRQNSGATKIGGRFLRFGHPGASDIIGCLPPTGLMLCIECKVGRNKSSDQQDAYMRTMSDAGARYAVVRTIEDLEKVLDALHYS